MTLAGIAGPWFSDLLENTQQGTSDRASDVLSGSKAGIQISEADYDSGSSNVTVTFRNDGSERLDGFSVTAYGSKPSQKVLNSSLAPGDITQVEIEASDPDEVEVSSINLPVSDREDIELDPSDGSEFNPPPTAVSFDTSDFVNQSGDYIEPRPLGKFPRKDWHKDTSTGCSNLQMLERQGDLYYGCETGIYKVDTSTGNLVNSYAGPENYVDFAVDSSENIYLVGPELEKRDSSGNILWSKQYDGAGGDKRNVTQVEYDPSSGDVYAKTENNRTTANAYSKIYRLDPSGNKKWNVTSALNDDRTVLEVGEDAVYSSNGLEGGIRRIMKSDGSVDWEYPNFQEWSGINDLEYDQGTLHVAAEINSVNYAQINVSEQTAQNFTFSASGDSAGANDVDVGDSSIFLEMKGDCSQELCMRYPHYIQKRSEADPTSQDWELGSSYPYTTAIELVGTSQLYTWGEYRRSVSLGFFIEKLDLSESWKRRINKARSMLLSSGKATGDKQRKYKSIRFEAKNISQGSIAISGCGGSSFTKGSYSEYSTAEDDYRCGMANSSKISNGASTYDLHNYTTSGGYNLKEKEPINGTELGLKIDLRASSPYKSVGLSDPTLLE